MKNLIKLILVLLFISGCEKEKNELTKVETQRKTLNEMAKVLSPYRGFTASDINSRSSNTGTHSVVSSTVEFTDIQMSKIRTVLGESNYSLASLCTSDNVNQWSGFSPYTRSYSNAGALTSTLVNTKPTTNFTMGSFAGYNHDAVAPGWRGNKSNAELDVVIDEGDTPIFTASFYIGEVDYPNAQGVALTMWNALNELVGFNIVDIDSFGERVDMDCELDDPVSNNTTYTGKIFIVDNLSQFLQSGGNVLCRVPNVDDYSVDVVVRPLTQFILDAGGFTVTGAAYNPTTGYVSFSTASAVFDVTNLQIIGRITTFLGVEVGSVELYNGAYTANTTIYALSGYLGMAPIPQYGYIVRLEFLQSE